MKESPEGWALQSGHPPMLADVRNAESLARCEGKDDGQDFDWEPADSGYSVVESSECTDLFF